VDDGGPACAGTYRDGYHGPARHPDALRHVRGLAVAFAIDHGDGYGPVVELGVVAGGIAGAAEAGGDVWHVRPIYGGDPFAIDAEDCSALDAERLEQLREAGATGLDAEPRPADVSPDDARAILSGASTYLRAAHDRDHVGPTRRGPLPHARAARGGMAPRDPA
jgi:hypothetical protein